MDLMENKLVAKRVIVEQENVEIFCHFMQKL
jgi:hypothetical protein